MLAGVHCWNWEGINSGGYNLPPEPQPMFLCCNCASKLTLGGRALCGPWVIWDEACRPCLLTRVSPGDPGMVCMILSTGPRSCDGRWLVTSWPQGLHIFLKPPPPNTTHGERWVSGHFGTRTLAGPAPLAILCGVCLPAHMCWSPGSRREEGQCV